MCVFVFFFKQKTAYEMRISDWSSDVCSSDLQWEFYGPMFVEGWTVPEFNLQKAKDLVKAAGYKGDPIPFRVLNNYYTSQVSTAQILVEMWRDRKSVV